MTSAHAASRSTAPSRSARRARLVYVEDATPGIRRMRHGKGFAYRNARGRAVRDARTLERIRKLAIPPAYTDVWICANPRGHLQATGRDARGRKQYRYHADWSAQRDAGKFDRIVAFGAAMPKLRRRVRADLKLPGLPRDKVCAIVLAVLAQTLIRVGNDEYARSNGSFGLTTLRDRHVAVGGGGARFRFRGKSGQVHDVALGDPRLAALVRRCQQLPGQHLFQYRGDDGRRHPLTSTQVNDYLREAMGEGFTSKDFRTWAATVAALRLLAGTPRPRARAGRAAASETALASVEKLVATRVAALLGNTPAVCRKAYIDPSVFAAWRTGALRRLQASVHGARGWESAALRFLRGAHRKR